ncbi:hydroxyethylthiazole kinase [Sneathiella marina]|uniref:Hydroxyethylthiazole kinase n=1 Tax=Sneathiella marina TaxID=2950108 RepID=A0ABY4W5W7_9PROT|nr:hydroxyethylthiazole kinase [Sneathiella marina]USG61508.1 hydroxyethylthiazole kinase [Sneathiella marina]
MNEDLASRHLNLIQDQRPAVHCLTNTVVQSLTANMLLAVGAIPSMSSDISEVADFTARSQALLVNIGTLDPLRKNAIQAAITSAQENNIPWILDPVLIDRAPVRLAYAQELIKREPAVIRGNAGEISALGSDPKSLARDNRSIVAVTGATDFVTDGNRESTLHVGHELMSRVTGIGCAGTAVLSAFCAVTDTAGHFDAVVAGLHTLGKTGENAARKASGPGAFAATILDEIYFTSQSSSTERPLT